MTMSVRAGGAWKDITAGKARVNGAWRQLSAAKVWTGGEWKVMASFASAVSLSLSPSPATRNGRTSTINSPVVTATPTGGLTPFTYSWVKQSGDAITVNSSTSASTTFQAVGMAELETRTAVFRCTATDTLGTAATADVTVTLHRLEPIDVGGFQ